MAKRIVGSLVVTALMLLVPGRALSQNYVFGPNVRVNDDPPGSALHQTLSPGQHLMAARGDTVDIVWSDGRGGTMHVRFARSDDGGLSFRPSVQVDVTVGRKPSLAVDDSGTVHISWLNRGPTGDFTCYARSTDGGQSFLPPIRACDSLHRNQGAEPSIAVSKSGRLVYVVRSEVWNDSYPGSQFQIKLSRSTDGGATFLRPDILVYPDTTVNMHNPSVAVFQDTTVLVAWTGPGLSTATSRAVGMAALHSNRLSPSTRLTAMVATPQLVWTRWDAFSCATAEAG